MKRLISFLLACMMLSTLSLNIVAADGITGRSTLSGENASLMSVTTNCPDCGKRGFVLYCGGISLGNGPEVYCSIPSHEPCVIYERDQFPTMGQCAATGGCHLGDGGQYGTYQYGIHIESCKHTRTGDQVYDTCYY